MYWLDTTILIMLGLGAALGFWSGLLWQVARVVSLGASFYACFAFNERATALLEEHLLQGVDPRLTRGVAYVAVFLAVYLILFAVTRLLQQAIRTTKLESFDRLFGALLGAAKWGTPAAAACVFLASGTLPLTQQWLERSTLAPLLVRGSQTAFGWLPEASRLQLDDHWQQLREAVQRQALEQALEPLPGSSRKKES